MSGTSSPHSGLTRRSFLKATGAAAGALGLAGAANMIATDTWLAPTQAHAEAGERVAYTYHQSHCGGQCSFKCTVRDERLCLIEPNDGWSDKRYATCCLKGLSEIQHVYSTERIQTPLKRVGERGEGEFVAITWDEAYGIFKESCEEVWNKYGAGSIFYSAASDAEMPLLASVLRLGTTPQYGVDMGTSNGLDPAFSTKAGLVDRAWFGAAWSEWRDWVNARYILNAGCNYLESSLVQSQCFFEAKEAGAKIVTVDPHFSTMAQKSDEWVPIEPGTDPALFLGMTAHILENDLYDEKFVREHTTFPFLISDDDQSLLTRGESITDDKKRELKGYLVWDSVTDGAKRYDEEGVIPVLEGFFEVDGVPCRTVFTKLKENAQKYSVAWAAKVSDIDEDKIREIATDYATSGASMLGLGYGGSDKYSNADITGHAAAVLVALTGSIGRPGASVGSWATGGGGYSAEFGAWNKLASDMKPIPMSIPKFDLPRKESNIHGAIFVGDGIQQGFADMNKTVDWVKSLDFVCYIDMYNMTTGLYADLILPACTKLEGDEEVGGVEVKGNHVALRQKVLDPLFESKPDFTIQREIAELFGYGDNMPKTAEEYVRALLENSADPKIEGITVESLKEHHGLQPMKGIEKPFVGLASGEFPTATKLVEIYYDSLIDYDQQLPTWDDNLEVVKDSPLRETYPLQFCQIRTKYTIHEQFFDASWIQQMRDVCVEMNPVDMEQRGLSTGDKVRLFNDRGSLTCAVQGNESVRPGVARMNEGAWTKYVDDGNYQELTNAALIERGRALPLGPVVPYNDVLVEVEKA